MAVADIIGKEFEKEVSVIEILKDQFLITMGNYSTIISKEQIRKLKGPIGPYRLDRYILNDFQIQGLSLFIFTRLIKPMAVSLVINLIYFTCKCVCDNIKNGKYRKIRNINHKTNEEEENQP